MRVVAACCRLFRVLFLAPFVCLACSIDVNAQQASPAPASADTVATIDGVSITAQELNEALGNSLISLRSQEYAHRRAKLDELVNRRLIEQAAKAKGMTPEEFRRVSIDAAALSVSDDEARAVYDSAKEQFPNTPSSEAIEMLRKRMQRQRVSQKESEVLSRLRAAAGVRILLAPPRVSIAPQVGRARGPDDAPIRIVEFSDFQCPYCARMHIVLDQVLERYPGRVRLEFRDFPLAMHLQASKAAEAGRCAEAQGKFWELHDVLFSHQQALQVPDLKKHARDAGLDARAFEDCLDTGKFAADVKRDQDLGQALDIVGTPTTFINGRLLMGSLSADTFIKVIDEELSLSQRPVSSTVKAVVSQK